MAEYHNNKHLLSIPGTNPWFSQVISDIFVYCVFSDYTNCLLTISSSSVISSGFINIADGTK